MAFKLLPVDYKDASWVGLKRYNLINNEDGTVSFQDVTAYSNKESSFFGAKDANSMNEALNTIMSMVENGTDLYAAFQNYFASQKEVFEATADNTQNGFNAYVNDLKVEGDETIESIKADYRDEIDAFENNQEGIFNTWFDLIKGQLSEDAAGNLQLQVNNVSNRLKKVPDFGIGSVIIQSSKWVDSYNGYYTYEFVYPLNDKDKVDVQLDVNAITILTDSGAKAMYAENMTGNRIRIYCIGKAPDSDITVQFSVTGVPTI